MAHDESKLPQWAQSDLKNLRQRVRNLEQRAATLQGEASAAPSPGQSAVEIDHYKSMSGKPFWIHADARLRFWTHWSPGKNALEGWAEVHIERDAHRPPHLVIYTNNYLVTAHHGSNMARVFPMSAIGEIDAGYRVPNAD